MPFPYDAADLAAIDRLANFYNGSDYDASTNPGGMGRGGHRINFENALADAARVGAANSAAAAAAGTSATNAATSESNAALSAAKLMGTSTTSRAIGSGSKEFTTQAGKFFAVGTFLLVYSAANPTANYMAGQVTGYVGTTLTVDVTVARGSGTYADWSLAVAGSPGAQGLPGNTGPVGPTPNVLMVFSDGVTDSDPGNGLLKLSNAAPASTTQIFADNLDRYGADITAWLDAMDDSTNTALRGTIKMVQVSDPTKYAMFNVTGAVIVGSGYRKIPVAFVVANGAFTNAAILAIEFVRTGNKGADGLGAGDVIGPAGVTDNHVAIFDGATGKLLKGGGALAAVATDGQASSVLNAPAGGISATNIQDALNELDAKKAPKESPGLTGSPTTPTAAPDTNTTQIASTAFVAAAAATKANSSHTHAVSEVSGLQAAFDLKAPLASPGLTGTPTAPTAARGSNSGQIATTALVQSEINPATTVQTGGVLAGIGTLGSATATVRSFRRGKLVYVYALITIASNGTGSGLLQLPVGAGGYTLPTPAVNTVIDGRALTPTGLDLSGVMSPTVINIFNYDNTYPGSSGAILSLSFVYEAA